MYTSTFSKCNKLWKKQNKSSQAADEIHKILGRYFVTPNITR